MKEPAFVRHGRTTAWSPLRYEEEDMYSPKISEELVPVLYRLAREKHVPMTRYVDRIIRQALAANTPAGESETANLAVAFPAESADAVA